LTGANASAAKSVVFPQIHVCSSNGQPQIVYACAHFLNKRFPGRGSSGETRAQVYQYLRDDGPWADEIGSETIDVP
jgi:hypothetical protein